MKTKRGFYFTIIVLFCLVLLLLVSFQIKRQYAEEGMKTRILTINNFIRSMERDASRAIYISSYRTMIAVMGYIASRDGYLEGEVNGMPVTVDGVFADALFNGSLEYSLDYPESKDIIANVSIKDWQDRTAMLASATNIDMEFPPIDPTKLTVTQVDPWNLIVSIPIQYNITDSVSGIKWYRETQLNTTVDLVDTFEDPLYIKEFGPSCGNKIIRGDHLVPLLSESCSLVNLTLFIEDPGTISGSMYINSTYAPSYIDRLKNNLTCFRDRSCQNPNGIESFFKNANPSCTITNATSTIVDFRYNHANADKHIVGAETWIHLGSDDLEYYGIPVSCTTA